MKAKVDRNHLCEVKSFEKNVKDAPKSYVIISAFLGNKRLAVYGGFLVLRLRISTQNTVTITRSSTLLDFIRYEGRRIWLSQLFVALLYNKIVQKYTSKIKNYK